MSFYNGPIIVTNGLVLSLDAADKNSYTGAGTNWRDISGNGRNGTLTNGPTFDGNNGGSIVFDGSNDFADVSATIALTNGTFLCWVWRNGTQNSFTGVLFNRNPANLGTATGLNIASDGEVRWHWNDGPLPTTGLITPNFSWSMIAISKATTSVTTYLGSERGINSSVYSGTMGNITLTHISVGRDGSSLGRYFTGRVAVAMIYNRELSASEISQNYNATKSRFGL
jgi:hypothetical protein